MTTFSAYAGPSALLCERRYVLFAGIWTPGAIVADNTPGMLCFRARHIGGRECAASIG
jgi:hypothetical protein